MREMTVGEATRAVAASGEIGPLCARDGAILAVSVHEYDVLVLSELPRLRFWHSYEKTIEIVARLVEDGDWNVRATFLTDTVQFGFRKITQVNGAKCRCATRDQCAAGER